MKVLLLDLDRANHPDFIRKELFQSSDELSLTLAEASLDLDDSAPTPADMLSLLTRTTPDLVFLSMGSVSLDAFRSAFRALRDADARMPIVLAAHPERISALMDLLRDGSTDFVTFPMRAADLVPRLLRLFRTRKEDPVVLHLKEKLGLRKMIGESPLFLEAIKKIPVMARFDASVLISGETGTGKEMCARAIHYLSSRSEKPFVALNCGAIPADLIENELFGHEREAFTGAASAKAGLIKESDGGTLFLDEVDSLPALAQVKLLRFLQEKEYRPLGSGKTLKADIRIIAASNLDLEKAAAEGVIRRDLYYRLNVIALYLPPLRQRRTDIPRLVDHFVAKYGKEFKLGPFEIAPEAYRDLSMLPWPGNIRQLEHVVQRTVLLAPHSLLAAADFGLSRGASPEAEESFQSAKARLIEGFEKEYIQSLLLAHKGNISHAAKAAKKNRRAFWQLMQKHGIDAAACRPEHDSVGMFAGSLA